MLFEKTTLPGISLYLSRLIAYRIGPKVSYEPSYAAFDTGDNTDTNLNRGRKTFGSFVADIDVNSLSYIPGNSIGIDQINKGRTRER